MTTRTKCLHSSIFCLLPSLQYVYEAFPHSSYPGTYTGSFESITTKIQIMVNIFRRKKSDKNEDEASAATASSGQEAEKTITLRVKIPPNVKPGDTFAVYGK